MVKEEIIKIFGAEKSRTMQASRIFAARAKEMEVTEFSKDVCKNLRNWFKKEIIPFDPYWETKSGNDALCHGLKNLANGKVKFSDSDSDNKFKGNLEGNSKGNLKGDFKNMIIQQAEAFRQPVPEQVSIEPEPDEQRESPSLELPVAAPQPQAVTSQIKIEGGAVIQLLHHMSRVFRGNMPVIPPALRTDSKRRRRLQEKRMAMGHKRNDHEDEQLHHVNDNTMR